MAGRRGVQLPWPCLCPPSLPPLLPFLSLLLLWPEEMEWTGGGPLSSHPLPEPKSGATLPPPEPGLERRSSCKGSAWSHCQEPGPSTLPRSPAQSLGASPQPPFRPLFWKEQSHPAPVPVPPVTLSCHSFEGPHLTIKLPHPRLSQQVEGLSVSLPCLTLLSSLRLRKVPWLANVTQPIRGRRI